MSILKPKNKRPVKKKDMFLEALYRTWVEFSQITSIQGIKYSTDPDTNMFFRIFWLIVVGISFICANLMVSTFYTDFMSNPTRMNVETDHAPLPDLKFPGITICSSDFISYVKTKEFVKTLKLPINVTQDQVISHIYQTTGLRMKTYYEDDDLAELQHILELNRYTVGEFMSSLRTTCDELLFRCRWQMEIVKCASIFHKSRTHYGTCCSFNIKQTGIKFLNQRATQSGLGGGLSVIVTPLNDDYAATTSFSNGFKLIVHKNNVYPSDSSVEKSIATNSEFFIRIRPEEITCSDQVRQLPELDRGCSFPEEHSLTHFAEYDEDNCEMDCLISNIIRNCECVPYYFLPVTNKDVCNFTKISCLVENYDTNTVNKANNKCVCPPNCQDIEYDVQANRLQLNKMSTAIDPFYNGIQHEHNTTVMHIYMASQTYRRMRRDLLSNIIQLIANFGAAYSLFLGISIISVIELLYFFTVVLRRYYLEIKETHEKVATFISTMEKPKISKWHYPGIVQVNPMPIDTNDNKPDPDDNKTDDSKIEENIINGNPKITTKITAVEKATPIPGPINTKKRTFKFYWKK